MVEITPDFGFALALCNWSDRDWSLHIHLGWPNIFLKLPLPRRSPVDQMLDVWGLSLSRDDWASIHLNWGARVKIVHLPWEWSRVTSEQLMADGSWRDRAELEHKGDVSAWRRVEAHPEVWRASLPYRYMLRSGQVQERTATICCERSEYRWRWLKWLPFPRKLFRGIDVRFSDEVGERSGSWKGGCVGCSYSMLPGETPEQCLSRMERERTFG